MTTESMPNGTGYLDLKNGHSEMVFWELDLSADGYFRCGRIWGREEHLARAAADGYATLRPTATINAEIVVVGFEDGVLMFSVIRATKTPETGVARRIIVVPTEGPTGLH